jgi:putative oxidoreductase
MIKTLIGTSNTLGPVLVRLALGAVIFAHGAQKALGWFGGYGWTGTIGFFTSQLGVTGTLTRVAAAGIVLIMIGAVLMVHVPHGFFMNWSGTQAGEGAEYAILATAMALSLVVTGAGRWSVDRALAAR